MNDTLSIIEKPDWVSWEDIRQCLIASHTNNRRDGINMGHYQWPAERIKEFVGDKGVMFVALDERKLVGTAAIIERDGHSWYAPGRYAFLGFAGVLPDYVGRGIYKALSLKREEYAQIMGYQVLVMDTHKDNIHLQNIAVKNGYRYVRYFLVSSHDHYNVVLAKWPSGCPYSATYCRYKFLCSKLKAWLIKIIVVFQHLFKK